MHLPVGTDLGNGHRRLQEHPADGAIVTEAVLWLRSMVTGEDYRHVRSRSLPGRDRAFQSSLKTADLATLSDLREPPMTLDRTT
jgi:hypothetical protein